MLTTSFKNSRRGFLGVLAFGATAFTARGAFAEELTRTPTTNEGPFYPTKLPLDTDNDLLIINDAITPAVGEITHLSGRLLDSEGDPIRNAVIEIWQCDKDGTYLKQHTRDGGGLRHELPGLRPLPDGFDRRVLLPDHQAGPLPWPSRGAHPRAGLEGTEEAADDRMLHQGLPGERPGRAVQADPSTRSQGPRDALPGFRPGEGV